MATHAQRTHRTHTSAGFLLAVALIIMFITDGSTVAAAPPVRRTLSLEDRVRYQRALEEVNWQYRIWPKENPQPKPSLEAVMPLSAIRAKVEDDLRKSKALEVYWRRPVTGAQLQAEMARMARATQQPERLRALWAALENDPFLIAECLARPQLVNRLIRSWYAGDELRHGELRKQAEAEVARYGDVKDLRKMSGEYEEVEWAKQEDGGVERAPGAVALEAAQWMERQREIGRVLHSGLAMERSEPALASARQTDGDPATAGPVGMTSGLQEREDGYYVLAVLEREEGRIRVATVSWRKRPFDAWWAEAGRGLRPEPRHGRGDHAYRLPVLRAGTACTDDTWTPTLVPPDVRYLHAAVWTGTEMIVWGGYAGGPTFNTGGRYDPITDTWMATSDGGAPSTRFYHTAVWTGTAMIVWGGDGGGFLNTGGRYDPITDAWMAMSLSGAPSARNNHTAVWTGAAMIVWGGLERPTSTLGGGTIRPATPGRRRASVERPVRDSGTRRCGPERR
ncbi:MAG: hypothetical protein HYR55_04315 [Acidobacteria bacterium]|nr:hypothetical protein [Acidobacteriota bacterium]